MVARQFAYASSNMYSYNMRLFPWLLDMVSGMILCLHVVVLVYYCEKKNQYFHHGSLSLPSTLKNQQGEWSPNCVQLSNGYIYISNHAEGLHVNFVDRWRKRWKPVQVQNDLTSQLTKTKIKLQGAEKASWCDRGWSSKDPTQLNLLSHCKILFQTILATAEPSKRWSQFFSAELHITHDALSHPKCSNTNPSHHYMHARAEVSFLFWLLPFHRNIHHPWHWHTVQYIFPTTTSSLQGVK